MLHAARLCRRRLCVHPQIADHEILQRRLTACQLGNYLASPLGQEYLLVITSDQPGDFQPRQHLHHRWLTDADALGYRRNVTMPMLALQIPDYLEVHLLLERNSTWCWCFHERDKLGDPNNNVNTNSASFCWRQMRL